MRGVEVPAGTGPQCSSGGNILWRGASQYPGLLGEMSDMCHSLMWLSCVQNEPKTTLVSFHFGRESAVSCESCHMDGRL